MEVSVLLTVPHPCQTGAARPPVTCGGTMDCIGFDWLGYVPKPGRERMKRGGDRAPPGKGGRMRAERAWIGEAPVTGACGTLVGHVETRIAR